MKPQVWAWSLHDGGVVPAVEFGGGRRHVGVLVLIQARTAARRSEFAAAAFEDVVVEDSLGVFFVPLRDSGAG